MKVKVFLRVLIVRIIIFMCDNRLMKLIVSTVKFNIKKLINYMAYCFPIATYQMLRLAVLGALSSKFFQVSDQFCECVR